MTPKTPARVIHTSIRVPVTAEEYAAIKRAAKLRGAPSLASWLRERGASHAFADGIEGLATAEDCKDALRRLLETRSELDDAMRDVTAREMPPERLAEVRERAARWETVPFDARGHLGDYIRKANAAHEWPGEDERDENRIEVDEQADGPDYVVAAMLVDALRLASRDRGDLLSHVEALAAESEARSEVRALREQRDEIREAHRVEVAALKDKLSTMAEAVAWYLELRARHAGSNGAHAEGYANALRAAHDDLTSLVDGEPATARAAHLEALTARLEAAERERETNAERCLEALDDIAKLLVERNAAQARADAAEAKLAALVEACERVSAAEYAASARQGSCRGCFRSYDHALGCYVERLRAALRAARGES